MFTIFFDSMLQQQWWRTGRVQKKLLAGSRRGANGTWLRQ